MRATAVAMWFTGGLLPILLARHRPIGAAAADHQTLSRRKNGL